MNRFRLCVCLSALVLALSPAILRAQNDFTQGFVPFGSYQSSPFDSVNVSNGNLLLHIPLVSYPQRGAMPNFELRLSYSPSLWSRKDIPGNGNVAPYSYWVHGGQGVVVAHSPALGSHTFRNTQFPYGTAYVAFDDSGASHVMAWTSPTTLESIDASGISASAGAMTDRNGIKYLPNGTIQDQSGNTISLAISGG